MRVSTRGHWDRYWQDRTETIEDVYANEDRILRQLDGLALEGHRVLEVGAGSGRDSLELAHRGSRIYVLDYVGSSFDVIRRLAREQGVEVVCVCADATRMPFREGSFALVFHQGLMEHFRDPRPLLRENQRVTEIGGHCLVDVPQRWHVYTIAKHVMIAMNRWFAGLGNGVLARRAGGAHARGGLHDRAHVRAIGSVPGFFYRGLPLHALEGAHRAATALPPVAAPGSKPARLGFGSDSRDTRLGLHTYAMISTLGRKDAR